MPRKHVLWWLAATGLAVLSFAFGACKPAWPEGRCLMVGADIALELRFDDPVVVTVEAQAADGRSWVATGYATIPSGVRRLAMIRPKGDGDLRFTLGVGGKLADRADGRLIADGGTATEESHVERSFDIREARITVQLQVARGTIATISLGEGAKTSMTATRPFPR